MLLNCPIIETSALKQTGLEELIDKALDVALKREVDLPKEIFSKKLEKAIDECNESFTEIQLAIDKKRWYAIKLLENDSKVSENLVIINDIKEVIERNRNKIEKENDDDMESIITDERYKFIQKIIATTVKKGQKNLTFIR